jgi:hypothetical protein
LIRLLGFHFSLSSQMVRSLTGVEMSRMPNSQSGGDLVKKLIVFRLALAGALVAISMAEVLGLSSGLHGQLVAGGVGAFAVFGLKVAHLL